MDDLLDYIVTEIPGVMRNGAAIPDTTTARKNDSLLLRAFKKATYPRLGIACGHTASWVCRWLAGEGVMNKAELLYALDAADFEISERGAKDEDDAQLLQILLRKAAAVLDERAKEAGDVMVFSADEGKALLALAQRGIRAMQAEQEQR